MTDTSTRDNLVDYGTDDSMNPGDDSNEGNLESQEASEGEVDRRIRMLALEGAQNVKLVLVGARIQLPDDYAIGAT